MVRLFCAAHHGGRPLCAECQALLAYAERRVDRCPFGDGKPTCAACPVHCYAAEQRERIREVMRFAGPRMLLRHPILALRHLIDSRRPFPPRPSPRLPRTTGRR